MIHSVSRLPPLVILLLSRSGWAAGRIPGTIVRSRHRTTLVLVLLLWHRAVLLVPGGSTSCALIITIPACIVVVTVIIGGRRGTWWIWWRLMHPAIGWRITRPVSTCLVRTGGVPVLVEGRGTGRITLDGASSRRTPITFPGRITAIVRSASPVVIHAVLGLYKGEIKRQLIILFLYCKLAKLYSN